MAVIAAALTGHERLFQIPCLTFPWIRILDNFLCQVFNCCAHQEVHMTT